MRPLQSQVVLFFQATNVWWGREWEVRMRRRTFRYCLSKLNDKYLHSLATKRF